MVECPCCGYLTLGEAGSYEICAVCFWEDDGGDGTGPNHMTLAEGQENFQRLGAVREDLVRMVRPSLPEEHPRHRQ